MFKMASDIMAAKIGRVERYINERLDERGALLFMLIDPVDYKTPELAVKTGLEAINGGADALLVGGSIGAQGELLDLVTKGIRDGAGGTPVILFPGNIATLTRHADAVYFMSLLNARNPYWITHAQMLSAPVIKQIGIEPLSVGYIVVSPGGTVGWVGDANLVPRQKPGIAASLALAGQYLGKRIIITDAGSNPQLQNSGPVPPEMIRAVKGIIDVPYIVAGGIRDKDLLESTLRAGADGVQIGTAIESTASAKKQTELFAGIVRQEGRKRL